MKVNASIIIPPTDELTDILKHEFSDHYSYKSFGVGSNKSIIIHKSPLIGVEIFVHKNEIFIEGAPPTLEGTFFATALQFISGLGMSVMQIASLFYTSSPWRKLEEEVGTYIQYKFG